MKGDGNGNGIDVPRHHQSRIEGHAAVESGRVEQDGGGGERWKCWERARLGVCAREDFGIAERVQATKSAV